VTQYSLVWQDFIDVLEEHTASIFRKWLAACLHILLPGLNDVASTCLHKVSKLLPNYMAPYFTRQVFFISNNVCKYGGKVKSEVILK
jgi:hypothetical protein